MSLRPVRGLLDLRFACVAALLALSSTSSTIIFRDAPRSPLSETAPSPALSLPVSPPPGLPPSPSFSTPPSSHPGPSQGPQPDPLSSAPPNPPPSPPPSLPPSPPPSPLPPSTKPPPPGPIGNLPDGLDIWVVAGQSNAVGTNYADGQPMPQPCSDAMPGRLLMFPAATRAWVDAVPSVTYISWGYPNMHAAIGPEMGFGRQLINLGASSRVGIIPTAVSNTALCNDWMPPYGQSYVNMTNAITTAMAAAGPTAQLRGLIWVQGEGDATGISCANTYRSNFRTFVNAVRRGMQQYNTRLPIVMSVMSTTNRDSGLPYIGTIRQSQLAADSLLSNIVKVDMQGLEFYNANQGLPLLWLHLTKAGACQLGTKMAEAWVQSGLQG